MKIYTKTGDKGQTSLIGGTRVPKYHLRIESYGTVDELNSWVGLIKDQMSDEESVNILSEIQDRLFTIGSNLASDPERSKMKIPDLHEYDVELLEKHIDKMNEVLPVMRSFILPGGHTTISYCHIARCVCRRAERNVIKLNEESFVNDIIVKYLNRLSDFLFVLSRYNGHLLKVSDIPWKARM
ncbi:MAG: cob(I)yrinic acid a,c-diamide adenosyltransferase [Bacteroidia bacterium]|nr:cob(I)yrinic acid a,c-diamide adenosyltransferase [Bacteroidia bacterium]MCZ2248829.1 cob(I)yrinic acid a,c-diamide adenosyltransferase [Bacteroidia bacterium]